jgi:uncharacterized membrane protein YhiD involved in acid resistance
LGQRRGGPASIQEAGLRLALAIVLSAAVGIDREVKHKPLGLRTNMLVALGAALFGATTGASIWVVGAIGMACGFGFYALALAVTVAGLFVLTLLSFVTGSKPSSPEDPEPRGRD